MHSHETQTTKTENTPDDTNPKNTRESELITQVQGDNAVTDQDLLYKRLLYGLTLIILATCLFIAAIYYGIINP